MKKFVAEKKRLLESYIEIDKMAKTDAFKNEISSILDERFPKYMEQLQERITKLTNDEIEICIFGWTSAGKSTFFNILLGVDIMPTQFLPDTPCLVRLHNSQTRKILYEAEGEKLTVRLTEDPQDAKCKLKAIFDQRRRKDLATLDVLDLYWPISRLHENIVFVDTPGIGENNSLTELVMKHVPKAAGYICVINSGDAGGILEGGIVQQLKAIADKEVQTENELGNVLFICNKWDMIPSQEKQSVSENTLEKLKRYFGVVEDWQIIYFSAIVEFQLMQLRASPTDDFLTILAGLERLVSRAVKILFFDFFGWIKNVIGKSMDIIDIKSLSISVSNAELKERTTKATTVLEETKKKLERDSRHLEIMVDTKKSELIKNLQEHLKRVQDRAVSWNYTDLKTKHLSELVKERICMLISEWANNDEGVLKKSIADAQDECSQFATDIEMAFCPGRTKERNIQKHFGFMMESAAITTFGTAMMALYKTDIPKPHFPLSLVALALTLSITGGMIHLARKKTQLNKLILKELEAFSDDESTGNLISTIFELPVKNWIKQYRSTMQCEIASQQKLVQELSDDVHLATGFQSTLESLSRDLNKSLKHLEKIGVEYYSDDSVSCDCLSIDSSPVLATEQFHLLA